MSTIPVSGLPQTIPIPSIPGSASATAGTSGTGFANYLSQAIDQANQLSTNADSLTAQYAAGGPVSVDQLMVAQQQASLALDMVVQVNNRVVSAYQSVMNMQI